MVSLFISYFQFFPSCCVDEAHNLAAPDETFNSFPVAAEERKAAIVDAAKKLLAFNSFPVAA